MDRIRRFKAFEVSKKHSDLTRDDLSWWVAEHRFATDGDVLTLHD